MTSREKSLERFKKNSQTEQEIDKGIQEDKQAEDDAEVLKRKLEQAQRALELAKKENANYKSAINEEEVGKIVSWNFIHNWREYPHFDKWGMNCLLKAR